MTSGREKGAWLAVILSNNVPLPWTVKPTAKKAKQAFLRTLRMKRGWEFAQQNGYKIGWQTEDGVRYRP